MTDFGLGTNDRAYGIAVDAGKVVVVGDSWRGSLSQGGTGYDFALGRYNNDGSLDASFGYDGKVTTNFAYDDEAYGVAIDAAGQIVVAGQSYQGALWSGGTGYDFALARYNASDGSLDTTFGTGGKVTTDFGSFTDSAQAVATDADGKIVVAGYSYQGGTNYDFALARYDADFGVGTITAPTDPVEVSTVMAANAIFADRDVTRSHTALWEWGDGTDSAGTVNEAAGTVTGSHSYTAAGVYTVTLTVNAIEDGTVVDSDQATYQYVVVFDPSGGFVSGGGTLDSPAGAWTAQPWLTGPANFGFFSKYQKGANTPDGSTVFRFSTADLRFRSTDYQWLVVAGAHAKYKGTGTINGSGEYGFMLTATDGQATGGGGVDTFRIKIWDSATSEVVYDNQPDEADDSNAGTAITAGNIIVNTGAKNLLAQRPDALGTPGVTLTAAALKPVVDQAIAYWGAAGYGESDLRQLRSVEVHLADFSDARLGQASSSTNIVWIDMDAAGAGWRLGPVSGGYDLLAAVEHELGHALGLDDLNSSSHDVMAGTLAIEPLHPPVGTSRHFGTAAGRALATSPRFSQPEESLRHDLALIEFQQSAAQASPADPPARHPEAVDYLLAASDDAFGDHAEEDAEPHQDVPLDDGLLLYEM